MIIKLDKNEMPRPPPKNIINSIKKSIDKINRYTPQEKVEELKKSISEYSQVPEESIILSTGSDILIKEFIFLFSEKRKIIIADPTFTLIRNTVEIINSPKLRIRLKAPDFKLNLKPLIEEARKPTLIVLDNPNNPTGTLILNKENLEMLLETKENIVLIDEAYYEFSNKSFAEMITQYQNLAVARTLSKAFGLAGSGIGYLIAGEKIRKKFSGLDIMLPYPSVIAGIEALKNMNYMFEFTKEIENEKKRVKTLIESLGLKVYNSKTNFFLIQTNLPLIANKLASKGIFVSDISDFFPSNYFRLTIGSQQDNNNFIKRLKQLLLKFQL